MPFRFSFGEHTMQLADILPQLTAWFEPSDHRERKIKGGGAWWYIPYQTILDRLNQVCPGEWHSEYSVSHIEPDGTPIYLCKLTICGVTKTGIGDKSNEPSPYGTPAQRAFRKAFTDACEQFGIASYLDDQRDEKAKAAFANYMHKRGNSKPAMQLQDRQRSTPKPTTPNPPAKPFGQPQPSTDPKGPELISEAQIKRFWAIARQTGYTDAAVKRLIEAHGFTSSKEISRNAYEVLCDKAGDQEFADLYNETAQKLAAADVF
jgi:hypothetical protein